MSDIYVFSSDDDANDYSTFGLVGALLPTEATFSETGNGESSVSLTHPLDEFGRYTALVKGNILLCPVPVRTTPEIQNGSCVTTVWTYKVKPLDQLTNKKQRTLYKKQKGSSRLKILNAGDIVTVVLKPTTTSSSSSSETRWKVKSNYGTGWIIPDGFELITEKKIDNNANAIQEVQSPWTVQPQRFRIYEVEKTIDEITVQARHISYDLLYNLTNYKSDESVTLQTALDGVMNNCVVKDHGFTAYTNVSNEQAGLSYMGTNPIDAMLNSDTGLCALYKVNLIRDNDELFFLHDPGMNRGVKIVYGKNMTGVTYTLSDDELATRIFPVGENKDGTPLYLSDTESEQYVDSSRINDYPVIHTYYLTCDNCTVGQKDSSGSKVTVAVARARMKQQAEDLLETGVDKPKIEIEVEYTNLGDTEEYAQFKNLENCFLYDYVIIQHPKQDIDVTAQIQEIEWDILTDRMNSITIGTVGETLANTSITTWQIPSGFSGSKIASGTVGGSALKENAISTRHLQADSINASVIAAGSITADRLDATTVNAMSVEAVQARIRELVAGQITTDQLYSDLASIAVAQITTANINKANITWADISTLSAQIASIANAEIGKASIGLAQIDGLEAKIAEIAQAEISSATIHSAQIEDASITTAKIALGAITSALIEAGAVGTAQIADGSITDAKIVSLNADAITAGTLSVERLLIKGENGLFRAINATDSGITVEQLSQEEYQNGMSGTVLVARSITADKIAAKTITSNEILAGTITAAEINVVNLFAAEATINALDSYLLKTETIEAIEGKLDIWASDKITAAVTGPLTPESVSIGSSITMDASHTEISTPYLDINVSGSDGDTHIDENGISTNVATFDILNCPEVVKRVSGRTITIDAPSGLQAELDRLNGHMVDGVESIVLACDQYGDILMRGIYGNNTAIRITGSYAINGSVTIVDAHAQEISFDGQTINCTTMAPISVYNSSWVLINNAELNTASSYDGVRIFGGSIVAMKNSAIYNAANALNVDWGGRLDFQNLRGTAVTYLWAKGCVVTGSGTRPSGDWAARNVIRNFSDMSTITIDTGSGETPPEAVTTVSYTASTTGTYYPSGHWISDNIIRQGYEGSTNGRKDYGVMWFSGASALSGKTIKSATLTLKRISGKGRSSAVTVKLWSTTVTGKSGTMPSSSMTSLGELGTIGNGETVTYTIPTSCIAGLASGGGLVLYTEETTCKTGKSYSEHYAHFEGTDGAAPVLTVMYQ